MTIFGACLVSAAWDAPDDTSAPATAHAAFLTSWNWSRMDACTIAAISSAKGSHIAPDATIAAFVRLTRPRRISSEGSSTGTTPHVALSAGMREGRRLGGSVDRARRSLTSSALFSRTFSTLSVKPLRSVGNSAGSKSESTAGSGASGPSRSLFRRLSKARLRSERSASVTEFKSRCSDASRWSTAGVFAAIVRASGGRWSS